MAEWAEGEEGGFTVGAAPLAGNGTIVDLWSDVSTAGLHREVRFLAEPRSSPQPLWFHLAAEGLAGCTISFIWANADTSLGDSRRLDRVRPVMRVDGGEWFRCPDVRVEETADGRRELRIDFTGGADRLALALCYPYTVDDLVATLQAAELEPWAVLGATGGGRALPRLRVRAAGEATGGVYVLARQHAGETPGSWVLDGMLRALAGRSQPLEWWVAPFCDLDGVEEGDYGKDAMPCDFNRAWHPLPLRPEVLCLQRDLRRFAERHPRRLVVDLHAPGYAEDGLYVFYPRQERPAAQRAAAREVAARLAPLMPELPAESLVRETRYASRFDPDATLANWAWDHLGQTPAISMETSYQSLAGVPLDIAAYRELGGRLVEAVEWWMGGSRGATRPGTPAPPPGGGGG